MRQPEFLRITEIISPFSGVEFVPKEYLEPAAERGTLVHSLIEHHLKVKSPQAIPRHVQGYYDSFLKFLENEMDLTKKDLILEKRFFCEEKMITGAIDCIIPTDEATIIIDWKTSSKPSIGWPLQAAAYRYLCGRNKIENVTGTMFVKLDKNGNDPKIFTYGDNYQRDLEIFDKCLELYHYFDMQYTRKR